MYDFMYRSLGKRILDILLAAMGLFTSLPFFIGLSIILWLHFNGTPFFTQSRPGLGGKTFTILKFRTMHDDRRISRFCRLLRRLSLDELPQFWNVLRGDMSMVGPRPLLPEYLLLYNSEQHRRHDVKPGMTGLAQVNGRNALSWEEKFRYDLFYVDNLSFQLDLRIICATVVKMLLLRKADGCGIETVPFKGKTTC